MLTYLFDWNGRELYRFIRPLFYQGLIKEVIKENYISKYSLENKKINKKELKKVIFISDKEEELKKILENNDKFMKLN